LVNFVSDGKLFIEMF